MDTRRPLGTRLLPRSYSNYTIRGAYLNYEEEYSGSIEVGKWADFVVLDRGLFKIPPHKIYKTKVLCTFLEGKEIYRASDWDSALE
jgi:predicted amidohydrolase YtcJ